MAETVQIGWLSRIVARLLVGVGAAVAFFAAPILFWDLRGLDLFHFAEPTAILALLLFVAPSGCVLANIVLDRIYLKRKLKVRTFVGCFFGYLAYYVTMFLFFPITNKSDPTLAMFAVIVAIYSTCATIVYELVT